jgi:hypothetical protein
MEVVQGMSNLSNERDKCGGDGGGSADTGIPELYLIIQ